MNKAKRSSLNLASAEDLALQGLSFLASDPTRLGRFLSLTGLEPAMLQNWNESPSLKSAVLEHLLSDESLLLVFCAETGTSPEIIAPAHALLAKDSG
jgi:hypothetical protein